ncbi:MAG TPA: nitroreductase family deazaflavin-dependent oxidoreductase [Ktedonobacterales bacterium]|nr:nitroreductase family deazaflavin-dependent oxidoreductase [Ktedonobacterales bacterium]
MRRRDRHHHRRPQQQHVRRMIVVFLAGVLAGMVVSLRLAMIVLWRSGAESFLHRVGLFNKRWTNRLTMRALRAGRRQSPYAVIRHVGRRSGQPYATPVITARAPDANAFIIPLAYGEQVDWYRNIRAAEGCTIEWQGRSYRVGAPAEILAAQAIPAFSRLWGQELRLYGITRFLQLPILAPITAEHAEREAAQPSVAQTGRRAPQRKRQLMVGAPGMPAAPRWAPLHVAWDAWQTTKRGPPAIAARQSERLVALVAYARERSPYYRRLYQQLPAQIGPDDLRQLPPTTKPELMAHFDEWVTDPAVTRAGVEAFVADLAKVGQLYLGRYLIFTTSGTTGVPALLLQDRRSLVLLDVLRYARLVPDQFTLRTLRRLLRHGRRGWGATVYMTGGHFAGASFTEWERRLSPLVADRLREFPVQAPLPELVSDLNAFDPVYLTGYASALVLLAQEQEVGRLRLHPLLVGSTAERLTPAARARIEAAFGCAVREGYSASEVPALAFACRQGRLHVNSDWYLVEPVDAAYQPVPVGQPSHTVVVTNLANYVQPIIRYDLGDSVTLDPEPCFCGSPLPVIHIEGRSGELLTFVSSEGKAVQLLPLALVTVVEETPSIHRCQLIQTAPNRLMVRFETLPTADVERVWPLVQQRLHAYLATQGLASVAIERASEPPSRDARSGKFRQVWSEVAAPASAPGPAAGATPAGAGSHVG